MKSEISILWAFFKVAVRRLLFYRANVLLLLVYWFVSMSVLIVFWKVLFQFLPERMGEWDFPRLAVLNSLCYISWGIFTLFWGLSELPEKVVSGDLDKYLSRPMGLMTGVIGDGLHLEALYEIVAGIAGAAIFILVYDLSVSFGQIVLGAVALGVGSAALILLHATLALLAFWFGRISHLQQLVGQLDDFQRYPISFFPKGVQLFFTYGVPLFFPSTFAAQILLGMKYDGMEFFGLAVIVAVWTAIYLALLQRCVKRYESHGS